MFVKGTETSGHQIDSGHIAKSRNLKFNKVHEPRDNAKIANLTGGAREKNLEGKRVTDSGVAPRKKRPRLQKPLIEARL